MQLDENAGLSETAWAKLNLALHVRHRRADGYHELETLFAFLDDGDRLTIAPSDHLSLTITGPFAGELSADADNLVLRAAARLREVAGVSAGAAFSLEKRLPMASGLGGGSADAAAALRLAARLWRVEPGLAEGFAAAIGADVPACLCSRSCLGAGVGAALESFDGAGLTGLPLLLVNPGVACPTGPVFKAWDGVDRGALDAANWRAMRNDLEAPAIALVPAIADVLAALRHTTPELARPLLARMSGSGATCFALYDSPAARDTAAAHITRAHPAWWQMAGALR